MRSLLLLLAVALVGCSSDTEEPGGVSADELTARGNADDGNGSLTSDLGAPARPDLPRYSVPVDSAELAPWSYYPVAAAGGSVKNGVITFHYPFPSFLTGTRELVTLEGPFVAGQTHVEVTAGALGHGTCDLAGGVWSCHEQLPGLTVNASLAGRTMRRAGLSRTEIGKRLEVTARFSVDPIGIFEMAADQIEFEDEPDEPDDDRSAY